MNEIQTLIEQIQQRGFQIVVEDGRVKVKGSNPPDTETRTLIETLRAHKDEVRAMLATPPCCWNCGTPWSELVTDIYGQKWRVCWACAKRA